MQIRRKQEAIYLKLAMESATTACVWQNSKAGRVGNLSKTRGISSCVLIGDCCCGEAGIGLTGNWYLMWLTGKCISFSLVGSELEGMCSGQN